MKNLQTIAMFLISVVLVALLVPRPVECTAPTLEREAIAQAVNAFALDLHGQFRQREGNLVFSPYGVSICLAMACSGARGTTESQMSKALHLGLQQRNAHEAYAATNARVLAAGEGKGAEINVVNALWTERSYPLQQEFVESVRNNYHGGLEELDFLHSPDAARMTINSWVEEQTKKKIKDLLAPGIITSDTRLVLTNAVYFKGHWTSEFKEALTRDHSFTLLNGTEIKVSMMYQKHSFGYGEHGDLQVLEMPYKGGELSMVVLLPSKQQRLEDFEQSMTFDKLSYWIRNLKTQEVQVWLPRFKMTSEFSLGTALTRLGMTDAFSQSHADFSGMTGAKDLFISEGVHKTFVEVNERGTEAAAATGLVFGPTSALAKKETPVPVFRADHPFVFLVRHKPTNCTLFLGRVTRP
jgi:serpin B